MQMLIQKVNLAYTALQYLHVTIKLTLILIIHVRSKTSLTKEV